MSVTWIKPVCILLMAAKLAPSTALARKDLVGSWDYATYTALNNGKPVGTINFKPHTMVFTYGDDGTWRIEATDATHTHFSGSFEIRGNELVLKKVDGSVYQDWIVEVRDAGKTLTLQDQRSTITASKLSQ